MKHLRRTGFLVVFGLTMILSNPAQGGLGDGLAYVPLNHWSYQAFYRLSSLGLIPLHALAARPITRFEAKRLVEEAFSRLPEADSVIASMAMDDLRNLSNEFSSDSPVRITIGGLASNRSVGAVTPYRALGASSIAVQFPLGSNLLFYGRAIAGGEVGDTLRSEVYASFQLGSVFGQLGRTSFAWGPSLRSNLLLSDNAGTLPVLSFSTELPRARLTKVIVLLERPVLAGPLPGVSFAPRPGVLFATRLDWSITQQFRLGVSEVVVTTWSFPLSFYHLFQPLPGFFSTVAAPLMYDALGLPHHIMATVDFDWLTSPGTRLYGELMIDDIPPDRARVRMGLLGGLYLSDPFRTGRTGLRLEYSLVTNETYNYPNGLDYTYQGRGLGHWLGPDGDDIYLELSHRVNESATLQVSYAYTRHGQGIAGYGSFGSGGFSLSGIVESRQTMGFQLHTIHSPSLESRLTFELSSVSNRANVAGAQALEGLMGLEVTYQWPSAEGPLLSQRHLEAVQASQPAAFSAQNPIGHLALRSWSSTTTSLGVFSGPPASTFLGIEYQTLVGSLPLSLDYEGTPQGDQMFWSADLKYPVMEFRDGVVSVLGGWGGLQFTGRLGGTPQPVVHSAPRLGADFYYRLTLNDTVTPFYFVGQITSDLGKATSAILSRPLPTILFFTYTLGVGWSKNGIAVEAGYRGVAAEWQPEGTNQTSLSWDGLYLLMTFR